MGQVSAEYRKMKYVMLSPPLKPLPFETQVKAKIYVMLISSLHVK